MQRQPHDEEDDERQSLSQATALPAPAELTRRAQGVAKLIKDVGSSLVFVKRAQAEHARSVGELGRLLNQAELQDAPWATTAAQLLLRWEEQSAQTLPQCGTCMQPHAFADFEAHNLRAISLRTSAYEQAFEAHAEAKRKVEGKQEKRRLPVLQQAEREAFRQGTEAFKVASDQLELLEEDLEKVMLNATRDLAHSQMLVHAQGLEHFSRVMQSLPAVRS